MALNAATTCSLPISTLVAVHNQNSATLFESDGVIKEQGYFEIVKSKYPDNECKHNIHCHVLETHGYFFSLPIGKPKKKVTRRKTI